jgi:diadenosine tetraphosphate (Ap4A) HIT family hydrolase
VHGEQRVPFDLAAYHERVRSGMCFVCAIAAGDERYPAHVVYRDECHIAFLPNHHVLLGYVLVAPVEHREDAVGDFALDDYLALQAVIHRVGRALAATVPTERIYVLSLGSRQGNAHVHWHVAALPPGVPYDQQQYRALMVEERGVLALSDDDQADLASRVRDRLREAAGAGGEEDRDFEVEGTLGGE